ncbi:TonB-dependent receptor [Roseovarius spongiae]|uniref:TonB-dependent receptor n=1 Tax=Roseovarius spongiae TaxID=2320272 RepID=A0A3A8B2F6_9RHOB|nr:TonB-dependent receptor [Roseovarius spongiae]RKF13593.1 TonB-dependent receptor [Roseovarius spongiae]
MTRTLLASTFLTSLAVGSTAAQAQQTYDLGTIVLSSSLSPVELGRTGASVEVLEDEDVGGNDSAVIDRLDRLPGVHSTANGGLGGTSTIQIRGLPAKYVGVRINGIDMADPSGPQNQFDFGGLTASGIGRIEVLKGSQSALYGSEAIAGVVNITTFRPEKLGFSGRVQAEAGSFGTYSGTLGMGYKSERGFVALSYGRVETNGISAQSFNTEKDGFEQDTITFSGEYDVNDAVTVGAALIHRDSKVEIDRFPPTFTGENYSEELGARVYTTLRTGAVSHTLAFNHFDIERKDPGGFTQRFTGERQTFSYLGSAELGARTVLNFGLEHTEEKFTSGAARGSEDDTAVKAELLFAATDQIDISAALRHDENSTFGGQATGRLAAVWRPVEDLAFRAVVGTGYRAPSLFERFGSNGVPTLTPEDSRSYELGVEKTFAGRGFAKATVFYTEVDDLIDYVPGGGGCASPWGCYNQIPGTTTSKGIELSGEYRLASGLSMFGTYTYTDAETDGKRLTRAPKHDLALGLSQDFTDRFSGYVDLRHIADVVPSAFAPAGHKVGDYTLVGAGVSYDVTENAELYLRIENLFDEDYETAGGFNEPGRAAYVGLRAKF